MSNKNSSRRVAARVLVALVLVTIVGAGLGLAFYGRPGSQADAATRAPGTAQQGPDSRIAYAAFHSASLDRDLNYAVLLPASYNKDTKRRYPVLYFLHGMNGNEREFERRGVAAAVEKMEAAGKIGEFIIVSPAGGNSFYINAKSGVRYEDAIVKDLIPYIESSYRAIGTPGGRAIQGISMGGFGALMIAFKHPEMFSSVTAHCAALFAELPKPSGEDRRAQFMASLIGRIFGDPPDDNFFKANNPFDLADSNVAAIKKSGIKIYFDVGDQDRYGFTQPNKAFDAKLSQVGLAHEFHVFPGSHGWDYMISVADHSYEFLWKSFPPPASHARAGE
jgi:S-formylglutathione hydrolase FrmB